MRYTYIIAKTKLLAELLLEDSLAEGDISLGEKPRIEARKDHNGRITHYEVTLEG